jgi:hypothetical protein
MKYNFLFDKKPLPTEDISRFGFPSGTPWPLFLWILTIIGDDGKRKGIVGELHVIVTKKADLVPGQPISLYLVTPFTPENMNEVFQGAKAEGSSFERRVLDMCIERLRFSHESARSNEIGFAGYDLYSNEEELSISRKEKSDLFTELMAQTLLLDASIKLKEVTGYELLSILEIQARLGIKSRIQ